MKKTLLMLLSLMAATMAFAQDVIIETSGTRTEARILTVNDAEIAYKRFSNLNGPTYTKRIEKIARIEYENGDVDDFLEQAETDGNIWGDATLPDLDYENYKGFLLAKGNVVYIPDGRTEYEKAAVQYLREMIHEDGFWVLAARKEQAHFMIVYEVVTKGLDHINMFFIQRRDPYTDIEISYSRTNDWFGYGDLFYKYGHIRTSEDVGDNVLAARKLYNNIKKIQEIVDSKKRKIWFELFER